MTIAEAVESEPRRLRGWIEQEVTVTGVLADIRAARRDGKAAPWTEPSTQASAQDDAPPPASSTPNTAAPPAPRPQPKKKEVMQLPSRGRLPPITLPTDPVVLGRLICAQYTHEQQQELAEWVDLPEPERLEGLIDHQYSPAQALAFFVALAESLPSRDFDTSVADDVANLSNLVTWSLHNEFFEFVDDFSAGLLRIWLYIQANHLSRMLEYDAVQFQVRSGKPVTSDLSPSTGTDATEARP